MSEQENIKAGPILSVHDLERRGPEKDATSARRSAAYWQKVFSSQTPVETTDKKEKLDIGNFFGRLSTWLDVNIHAIALNVANIMAAARGGPGA